MSRGRKPGFVMTDDHRTKIANSRILKCLIDHVEGKLDMSATQVSAGLGLLRKVMPDLAASADMGNYGELKPVARMTDDELEAIAAGGSVGTPAAPESPQQLN
jgi:hypothetical protein